MTFLITRSILLDPTYLKNENIYDHFKNNHGDDIIQEAFKLLENDIARDFKKYLNNRSFSLCNMFITKPDIFINYCDFIFPLIFELLKFCKSNNMYREKHQIACIFYGTIYIFLVS